MPDIDITNVRIVPATSGDRDHGLLAFAAVTISGIVIERITVRRTVDGRHVLSFPLHRDRAGVAHSIVRPLNNDVRRELTDRILAELDRHIDGGAR